MNENANMDRYTTLARPTASSNGVSCPPWPPPPRTMIAPSAWLPPCARTSSGVRRRHASARMPRPKLSPRKPPPNDHPLRSLDPPHVAGKGHDRALRRRAEARRRDLLWAVVLRLRRARGQELQDLHQRRFG